MTATTPHDVDEPGDTDSSRPPRRRPTRRTLAIAIGSLALLVALPLSVLTTGDDQAGETGASGLPPSTTEVATVDLTSTEAVEGTLTYGAPVDVTARSGQGTVTWLAPAGSAVGLGQPLYKVDERPVVLVHGTIPPYRTLEVGVVGGDVQQLEQSLAALGHTGFTVDTTYTSATAAAVTAWQADLGLPQTGTVGVEQIVVAPGDVRVAGHVLPVGATLGGDPNQTVLTTTGATRVVTVDLDVAQQHLVAQGDEATVLLPDGTEVAGTVAGVGTGVQVGDGEEGQGSAQDQGPGESQDGDTEATPTVEVTVSIHDQAALGTLDAAPVSITLVTDRRDGVLAVPVAALVALSEGGYGVQVVEHGEVSYVPVETGLFADGLVEVSGEGVAEGTVVGVPA